tara:strand:- start:1165 stop:1461 length:297 start_codon:yes stop_codon:yes gene_type:complete
MENNDNKKNLKIFFIKLISITVATIILFNVLFNLLISNIPYFRVLSSLTELETRRDYRDNFREDIRELLKKDQILKREDKVLIYKFYQKLKSEFEDIK